MKRVLVAFLVLGVVGCGGASGGQEDAQPAGVTCDDVTVPGHRGTEIRVSGVGCGDAQPVVAAAEGRGRAGFEADGFRCEPADAGGGDTDYTCADGDRSITFRWGVTDEATADGARQLDPAAFARATRARGVLTVDVHVPYEGELPHTDRFVDYRDAQTAELPHDRRIALYCRSGRMSRIAARTLRARGYDDLVELAGGMEAWEASGRSLLHRRG